MHTGGNIGTTSTANVSFMTKASAISIAGNGIINTARVSRSAISIMNITSTRNGLAVDFIITTSGGVD